MRAIILAAGRGSRLNGTAGDAPKCLVEAGGMTLLARQIETLGRAGIEDIAVVVGCQAERVREACGHRVTYVENTRYAQTNSMYSLWMARPLLYEGFVVLNCDVLFHPVLLDDLLSARHENALLLAYREANQPAFGDEEMKVKVRCGRVVEMSKTIDPAEADGENLGIVKFGAQGAAALVGIMDRLIGAGGTRDWAPRAFDAFAQTHPLHAIGTRGLPWIEIDFPDDYQRAVREVLPRIEADGLMPRRGPVRRGWDGVTDRRVMRADRRSAVARPHEARRLADAS
jgi:choline kinase